MTPVPWPPGLGAPARRALHAAGYTALEQLDGVSADELRRLHGVGPRALRVIQEALAADGRSLR
jgi:hypothetical protein